jgi:hypothetical protein
VTGPVNPDDFPPDSILYQPRNPLEPAELISKEMRNYLTSVNRPLTSSECHLDERAIQLPALFGFAAPPCQKHTPRLVGLYAGGKQFHCGVYHPTGVCIMRKQFEETAEFCVVCRYILVDQINPYKHPVIDRDYDLLVGPETTCC